MPGGYHLRISLDVPTDNPPTTPSSFKQRAISSQGQIHVPKSLFDPLPAHTPKSTVRRNTFHDSRQTASVSHSSFDQQHRDYRFGPLTVEWIDFESMDSTNYSTGKKVGVGKEREGNTRGGPAIATFIPSRTKSGSTNLPEGVVHIYRDTQTVPETCPTSDPSDALSSPQSDLASSKPLTSASSNTAQPNTDGILLGVLAVPSWMTPADFLAFVAPAADGMAHLRMIRDSAPNRSLVVINFREGLVAAEFAEAYNGKQFNSMEPEICHVVRLLSVEVDTNDSRGQVISRVGASQIASHEIPTCPVCLERMDSAVTGLVTVPCSHTFHCACLSKWGDSRCPVCRYSQTLLSSHPTSPNTSRSTVPIPFTASPASHCADCLPNAPSNSNLWICLICGNIGCGRYGRAHAQAHYERTTHLYALELETQRVWDYAGDGYVHRLIQNKADGKLVELPSAASSITTGVNGNGPRGGPSTADALSAEKIEAIGIEYSYLLTSQLDSQRTFYEEQTTELKTQVDELRKLLEGLSAEVEKSRKEGIEELACRRKMDDERIEELDRVRVRAEKRAEKATELARTLEKELKGERAVSEGLMKNLAAQKERAEKLDREKAFLGDKVKELEEQVRDIMFFVDARSKIEDGGGVAGEAAGGSLQVPPPNGKKKKGKKG